MRILASFATAFSSTAAYLVHINKYILKGVLNLADPSVAESCEHEDSTSSIYRAEYGS